jgi:hypothetical protein
LWYRVVSLRILFTRRVASLLPIPVRHDSLSPQVVSPSFINSALTNEIWKIGYLTIINIRFRIRCQTKSEAIHIIKHVKKACYRVIMRKTKIKYPWTSLATSDFVVFCCHSIHISEYKPLHDDSFLRKIFSLSCSTIFHW